MVARYSIERTLKGVRMREEAGGRWVRHSNYQDLLEALKKARSDMLQTGSAAAMDDSDLANFLNRAINDCDKAITLAETSS